MINKITLYIGCCLIGININACANQQNRQCENLLKKEFNKISQIDLKSCDFSSNKLEICYVDSVPFYSAHVEAELGYYILREVIDQFHIDSVSFIVRYPNRPENPHGVYNISGSELRKNIAPRYTQNPKYLALTEELFNEKDCRVRTIAVLCYWYGYVIDKNPKQDFIYDENIFQLLYACTLDAEKGEYGLAMAALDRIHGKLKMIKKNSEYYSGRIDDIKWILNN